MNGNVNWERFKQDLAILEVERHRKRFDDVPFTGVEWGHGLRPGASS